MKREQTLDPERLLIGRTFTIIVSTHTQPGAPVFTALLEAVK